MGFSIALYEDFRGENTDWSILLNSYDPSAQKNLRPT